MLQNRIKRISVGYYVMHDMCTMQRNLQLFILFSVWAQEKPLLGDQKWEKERANKA